ncbi:MAG TPA: class I SAM-dependent methyltransferase [Stellaceae bacterium]|nr:class I SAM-dependent methyltransferase [Stellaceae bacterium]
MSFVRELFNRTAPHYDTVNNIFSLGWGNWYRRRCLLRAGLKSGHHILDVAIGTGLIACSAIDIVGSSGMVIGLDLSEAMLAEARRKLDIPLIQGIAETLPLADASVDFITMGYAIRHIADIEICFREFRRILKPDGKLLLLEVSSPQRAFFRNTLAKYLGHAVPWLSRWITGRAEVRTLMIYHWETMENCIAPEVIQAAMARNGFKNIVCETWFDLFRSYAAGVALPSSVPLLSSIPRTT